MEIKGLTPQEMPYMTPNEHFVCHSCKSNKFEFPQDQNEISSKCLECGKPNYFFNNVGSLHLAAIINILSQHAWKKYFMRTKYVKKDYVHKSELDDYMLVEDHMRGLAALTKDLSPQDPNKEPRF